MKTIPFQERAYIEKTLMKPPEQISKVGET